MQAKKQDHSTEPLNGAQVGDDFAALSLEMAKLKQQADRQIAEAVSYANYMQGVVARLSAADVTQAMAKLACALIAHSQQPEQGSRWRVVRGINTAKKLATLTGMSAETARDALRQLVGSGFVSTHTSRARVDKNGNEIDSTDYDHASGSKFITATTFAVSADVPKSMTAAATAYRAKFSAKNKAARAEALKNRALIEDIMSAKCPHCGETGCMSVSCTACGSRVEPADFGVAADDATVSYAAAAASASDVIHETGTPDDDIAGIVAEIVATADAAQEQGGADVIEPVEIARVAACDKRPKRGVTRRAMRNVRGIKTPQPIDGPSEDDYNDKNLRVDMYQSVTPGVRFGVDDYCDVETDVQTEVA